MTERYICCVYNDIPASSSNSNTDEKAPVDNNNINNPDVLQESEFAQISTELKSEIDRNLINTKSKQMEVEIGTVLRIKEILEENFYRLEDEKVTKIKISEVLNIVREGNSSEIADFGHPYLILYYKLGSIQLPDFIFEPSGP